MYHLRTLSVFLVLTFSLVLVADGKKRCKKKEACMWVEDECTSRVGYTIARCAPGKICRNYDYLKRENVCPSGYELHKSVQCTAEGENPNNFRHFCCQEDRNYEVDGLPYLTPLDDSTIHNFPNIVGENIPLPHDPVHSRNTTKSAYIYQNRWPMAQIPYYINYTGAGWTDAQRQEINKAIQNYETNTCLRFYWATNANVATGYVSIENDPVVNTATNCGLSQICGPYGGRQFCSVGPPCANAEWLVHELGHSLCFSHEHQRADRDTYIYFNRQVCTADTYPKDNPAQFTTQGIAFDFQSIMMYPGCRPGYCFQRQPGQGSGPCGEAGDGSGRLSPTDIRRVNLLYNCDCTRYRC